MCGIVGVVSRPPTRPTPTRRRAARRTRRCARAPAATSPPSRRGRGASTPRCTACPGCSRSPATTSSSRPSPPDSTSSTPTPPSSTPRSARRSSTPTSWRRPASSSIALRDVLWALRRDRLRTAAAVADLAGPDAGAGRARRLPRDPAGVLGDRPHGGPRPRLGRHPRLRVGPRPRRRRPGDRRRPRRPSRRPAVPDGSVRVAGGACRSSTRPPPRSVSSATTPGRCAPPCAPTSCCASRSPATAVPASPCSATPAGPASASSPSPTPTR